jgi:hypothetical protein
MERVEGGMMAAVMVRNMMGSGGGDKGRLIYLYS